MEYKKYPEVNIYQRRPLFLMIGMIISLLIVLTAFEWKQFDKKKQADIKGPKVEEEPVLNVPQTVQKPPKPKVQQPEVVEADPEEEIEEEEVKLDMEIDEDMEVEAPAPDEGTPGPPAEETTEEVFNVVENNPEFPGGNKALMEYLSKNIDFPEKARRMGISGKVYVQFVVGKDGSINNAKVVRGIGGGCDKEALEVVKNMPKWEPGKQRGRPVKVRMSVPINFSLSN